MFIEIPKNEKWRFDWAFRTCISSALLSFVCLHFPDLLNPGITAFITGILNYHFYVLIIDKSYAERCDTWSYPKQYMVYHPWYFDSDGNMLVNCPSYILLKL